MPSIDDFAEQMRRESERIAARLDGELKDGFERARERAEERVADLGDVDYADAEHVARIYREALVDANIYAIRDDIETYVLQTAKKITQNLRTPALRPEILARATRANLAFLDDIPDEITRAIRSQLKTAVTEPVSVIQIARQMEETLSVTYRQARVLMQTAFQTLDQTILVQATEALGAEWYEYKGPDDVITRPFCRYMIGRAYTREALAECNNAQIPNVIISRGGYNCRHRLVPMTPQTAKRKKSILTPNWTTVRHGKLIVIA